MSSPGGGGDLGSVRGKIIIDANEAEKGVKQAEKAITDLQRKQEAAAAHLKSVGTTAAQVYGTAVVAGFALAVNSAKDFEQALANVKAAGGKAAFDQMEAIRQKALQLGADTSFSSIEAANAMEVLIKAGLSVSDVLNGAADAAVNLAAAEGITIPEAAEIAAVAMTAFNLEAKQLPSIANEISQAASATKMNVKDFSYAMNQAGAVSKLVGLSFDDMTLAITAMGKAGIVGSDAGTSLKTMLMNLIPRTKDQIELSRKLGLLTKDGANAFFDQTGKVKSMTEIAGVLNNALKGMSQQQKLATLETLFGADAIRAAAIISEQGAAGMKNLTAEMNSQLSVAEKAKVKQDTLAGAIEKMKGSIETAAIQVGTAFIPIMRQLAEAIEKGADWFSKLNPQVQQGIMWFLLGSTALLGFGFALAKTITIISEIATVLRLGSLLSATVSGVKTLGLALYATGLQARAAMVSMAQWIAMQTRAAAVAVASAARMTAAYVAAFAVQAAGWIRAAAVAMANALIMAAAWLIANPWVLIIAGIIALVAIIIANWDKIKGWLLGAWEWIKEKAAQVWNAISDFFKEWWPFILGIFTGGIGLLVFLVIKYWDDIKQWTLNVWNSIKNFFVDLWNTVYSTVRDFLVKVVTTIVDGFNRARDTISGWISNVLQWFRDLPGNIVSALGNMVGLLFNAGKDLIQGMINGVKQMAGNIANAAKDVVKNAINAAKSALGISSPSKVFFEIGTDTGQGFENALLAKRKAVAAAMEVMATGGLTLTGPTSPFASPAAAVLGTGPGSPVGANAAPVGKNVTINIGTVEVPINASLNPTNPVEWREAMGAIKKGVEDYTRSY